MDLRLDKVKLSGKGRGATTEEYSVPYWFLCLNKCSGVMAIWPVQRKAL